MSVLSSQFSPGNPSRSISNSNWNNPQRGNFILRQELISYTPECSATCGMIMNTLLFFIFGTIGILIVASSRSIIEYKFEYTDCSKSNVLYPYDKTCQINLFINETIKAPVYLYYHLENFYFNHRTLVKSKIWAQSKGKIHIDSSNNSKCEGAKYVYEMFDNDTSRYFSYWGKPLNAYDYANPCGLVAKSFFNDTFELKDSFNKNIFINETGIANKYEKSNIYKRHENFSDVQWIDVENEHFIVWMAMETYSSFRKLWGRIEEDIQPGNYTVYIDENFNTSQFNAQKYLILTTSTNLGTSSFYGYILIFFATYSAFVFFTLWVFLVANKDKKFDYNFLKWR